MDPESPNSRGRLPSRRELAFGAGGLVVGAVGAWCAGLQSPRNGSTSVSPESQTEKTMSEGKLVARSPETVAEHVTQTRKGVARAADTLYPDIVRIATGLDLCRGVRATHGARHFIRLAQKTQPLGPQDREHADDFVRGALTPNDMYLRPSDTFPDMPEFGATIKAFGPVEEVIVKLAAGKPVDKTALEIASLTSEAHLKAFRSAVDLVLPTMNSDQPNESRIEFAVTAIIRAATKRF